MRTLRIALATLLTILALFLPVKRAECRRYVTLVGGSGYSESRTCPALAPAVLFAAVTLGAIIAILLKADKEGNGDHDHIHGT